MKTTNLKKAVLTVITVIALGATTAFAGINNTEVKDDACKSETVTEKAIVPVGDCQVTNPQVAAYLIAHGYTRIKVLYWTSECTAICDTAFPYNTAVYTSGTSITGHEDLPAKK